MVLIVGEILCDLIGVSKNKNMVFGSYVGGAPFNVAYNLSSLGVQTTFHGNVGKDAMGNFIVNKVKDKDNLDAKINIRDDSDTTLAFYTFFENGIKDFSFFRKNTADFKYNLKQLKALDLNNHKIVHFGSLFLSKENARKVMEEFIQHCKKNNKILTFDFNYRKQIFKSSKEALKYYKKFLDYFDVIKFNKKELLFYTNTKSVETALKTFKNDKLVFVTLGKKGCVAYINEKIYQMSAPKVKKADTVGTGDSFFSGILYYLKQVDDIYSLSDKEINDMLLFANSCGAMTAQVAGALDGYKSIDDVKNFILQIDNN